MHRSILGLVDEGQGETVVSTNIAGTAIDVRETYQYLDDATIQHGLAATRETTEGEFPEIDGDSVSFIEDERTEIVATEFFADLAGAGFVSVDSSDGEFLFQRLGMAQNCTIARAELDTRALAGALEQENATWTAVGTQYGPDDDPLGTTIAYGEDAREQDPTKSAVPILGFEYTWGGTLVSGICSASGYVAQYEPSDWTPEEMARWLRQEMLPYASVPDEDGTEQETLDEGVA